MPTAVPTTSSIDIVILKCRVCSVITNHVPPQPLTTARAMKLWIQTQPTVCPNCGSTIRTLSTHVSASIGVVGP